MAKNLLVINVDIRETRVALIENGVIAELHLERHGSKGTLGNIYLGKVSRVLPGMQAAFIDIGEERAAFLHVEDLIRPDDFEAYLSGNRGRNREDDESRTNAGADRGDAAPPTDHQHEDDVAAEEARLDAEALVQDALAKHEAGETGPDDEAEEAHHDHDHEVDVDLDEPAEEDEAPVAEASAEDDDEAAEDEAVTLDGGDAIEARADSEDDDDVEVDEVDDADADVQDEPVAAEAGAAEAGAEPAAEPAEEGAVEGGAPLSPEDEAAASAKRARSRRGGRGRRRRGRTADRVDLAAVVAEVTAPPPPRAERPSGGRGDRQAKDGGGGRGRDGRSRGRDGGRGRNGRDGDRERGKGKDPLRVSRSTPIREVVREGQEVIVQVSKEPIGTKGARVTSHISLPGRYVVYLPTVEHIGISKRIGSEKERGRLREAIEAMKPPQGGLIVRTLAEGLTKKSLKADVGYLVRLWGEIAKKRETTERAPTSLYVELDLVLKTARDLFTDDIEKIVIDSKEEYARLKRFIEMFMPERANAIELYEGQEPIFDEYGIEDEIGRALSRKVPLNSGGHLIIDQAEALTAIDVNTGRFVGKGSKDLEETILQTNLEAVEEIAYQLRFRNIGGLIILDLIDMDRPSNREKVRRKLEQLLAKDKAKTTLNRISELGLIEMTRKRTRESLGRQMNEPCFYCDGTGNLQSKQTVAYEILRQIKRERANLRGYGVIVNAHPAIVDLLKNEERGAVQEAERRYTRRIELVARKEYHLEQFDLTGK
jgi:ribonuclease G